MNDLSDSVRKYLDEQKNRDFRSMPDVSNLLYQGFFLAFLTFKDILYENILWA